MARTLHRLSDRTARTIDVPGLHPDGGGLYLQVTRTGARSWVFRFGLRGRTRDMGLSSFRFVTITDARAKAAEARALLAKGSDPIESAKAERNPAAAAETPPKSVKPHRDLHGGFVFPGTKRGRSLSDMTLSKLVKAMEFDVVQHGFRATFKTWAEETTDHARPVIEAALAHIIGDKTEASDIRGDWLEKRRGSWTTGRPTAL